MVGRVACISSLWIKLLVSYNIILQYNFTGLSKDADNSLQRRKEGNQQQKWRFHDQLVTHFSVGNEIQTHFTENKDRYEGRPKNDRGIKPAGKSENKAKEEYGHLDHSRNTQVYYIQGMKGSVSPEMPDKRTPPMISTVYLLIH